MILNANSPNLCGILPAPTFPEPIFLKNVKFEDLPEIHQPLALQLKSHLQSWKNYRFDLKVQDLTQGQVPCIPGWHVDNGPFRPAEYALITFGSSKTEFYTDPLEMPEETNMKILCHQINQLNLKPSFKLKDGQIVVYNNTNIHRGSPADYTGKRLLIRAMGYDKS